jgi:hypothetical protein
MDTPIQRVKFREIGALSFILGFHSVELDIRNRIFRALSPVGTITAQSNDVLGKVLRFEGDLIAIHTLICRCSPRWIVRARHLIDGQISFGKYVMSSTFYPLATLQKAMFENWATGEYDRVERKDIMAAGRGYSTGPIFLEATIMRRYLMKILTSRIAGIGSTSKSGMHVCFRLFQRYLGPTC